MYDLIEGPNGSLILDIAVPGLRNNDLEASLEGEYLTVKRISGDSRQYFYKGIKKFTSEKFRIGPDYKIDLITCDSGILRVLMSLRLELGSKIAIQ